MTEFKDWLSIDKPAIPDMSKRELITIRVTKEEKEDLKKASLKDRVSLSQYIINPAIEKARS